MSNDTSLYADLVGALEPGPAQALRAALAANPAAARRRARFARALEALIEEVDAPTWTPALFAMGGRLELSARSHAVMDLGPTRTVPVHIPVEPGLEAHHVLVLIQEEGDGGWSVELPRAPTEWLRLSELPQAEGGEAVLDLVRGARLRRFAVALLPPDVEVDWSAEGADRWSQAREAISAGRARIGTVEIPPSP